MNILFCGDSHAEDGVLITTLSLLKHVKEIHIYVLTMVTANDNKQFYPFSSQAINLIEKIIQRKNPKNTIKLFDITDLYEAQAPKVNQNTRFTPYAMLRLFADQIPEIPDRILYLDDDIIIRKNIDSFYNQNLHDTELVGILDYYGRWFFHNRLRPFDYINSGVLLLNMKEIKKTNLFARVRKLMQTKKMFLPDQTAINKLAKKKKYAPRKYNEQRKLHSNTVIQHFTTSFRFFPIIHTLTVKPWQVDKIHSILKIHDYDDILNEYLKLQPLLKKKD
ncbi:glycosyltransferase [Lactobacillus sp.]|uniref:glycosyltransferase n=1 Tax=Lactobacillus sp. TaxID=1591 RepID=UPI00198A6590|nr:glycosyltransferase [Lactobacillus sp.]MBD5429402.1 glycosyltransferase family 8 protein [Lactobacillus sp.]MBD5430836.1 glycosyltransferase family 8 protein [Lactobacillus sp.]